MLTCRILKLSWKRSGRHSRQNDTKPFAKVSLVSQEWKAADRHRWKNISMMEITSLTELDVEVLNNRTSIIQSRAVQTFQCSTPTALRK